MKKFDWFEFTLSHNWAYNLDFWWRHSWVSTVRAFIYNAFHDPYKKERKCIPRYTWKDRDTLMEEVVFTLFKEYCDSEDKNWNNKFTVEEMYGQPISKDDSFYDDMAHMTLQHNDQVDEMIDIYNYIESRKAKWEEAYNSPSMEKEDELHKTDTEYLIKIIKLRGGLWT